MKDNSLQGDCEEKIKNRKKRMYVAVILASQPAETTTTAAMSQGNSVRM